MTRNDEALTDVNTALAPYTGDWNTSTAAHLLRRTTMGPRLDEINEFARLSTPQAVDRILEKLPAPPPPVMHRSEGETVIRIGETWVNAGRPKRGGNWRGQSLKGWLFEWLGTSEMNIQAQMMLFWINYFGFTGTPDVRMDYKRIKYFQANGTGSFKKMIEMITVDPGMLHHLNGKENSERHPNENYAREFLELYSIQKGDLIAPDDYGTYTEQDVIEVARIFTGWRLRPFLNNPAVVPIESRFDPERHDTGEKILSYHFDNAVINNHGKDEYKVLIDVVFQQRQTARSFCRELYRYFVFSDLSDQVESTVIEPMTDLLINSNFEIKPVLKVLFNSRHFYDINLRGAIIKHPIDFELSILRPLKSLQHVEWPSLQRRYEAYSLQSVQAELLGMHFLRMPTVAGLSAYHQEPVYYRAWISPSALQLRQKNMENTTSRGYSTRGVSHRLDWKAFLKELSDASDPDKLVEDSATIFHCFPLNDQQKATLLNKLMPNGLDASEWANLYQEFQETDLPHVIRSFEERVIAFYRGLFGMLEFQLK